MVEEAFEVVLMTLLVDKEAFVGEMVCEELLVFETALEVDLLEDAACDELLVDDATLEVDFAEEESIFVVDLEDSPPPIVTVTVLGGFPVECAADELDGAGPGTVM